MAAAGSMSRLFRFLIFGLCIIVVVGRFCSNPDCSEPISSARIKKPFIHRDVHLYSGDEVDIISKSDDGSHFEFEIGDVRGIIPEEHIKEDSFPEKTGKLVHVPETDNQEDEDEMDNDYIYDGMQNGETFNEDMFHEGTREPDLLKKKKTGGKKKVELATQKKTSNKEKPIVVPPGKALSNVKMDDDGRNEETLTDYLKTEDQEMLTHLKMKADSENQGDASKKQGEKETNVSQTADDLQPKNQENEKSVETVQENGHQETSKTIEGASEQDSPNMIFSRTSGGISGLTNEVLNLPNFRIMKKRYINDYLVRNYAGKEITEEILKHVQEFVQNDMLEQIKEPESDLLHMLLHYETKDLPGGGSSGEKEEDQNAKEAAGAQEDAGTKASEQEKAIDENLVAKPDDDDVKASKVPIKEGEVQSEKLIKNKVELDGGDNTSNESLKDNIEKDAAKDGASVQDERQKSVEDLSDEVTQHPNFDRLKKKHVENYLKTHYSGEEVNEGIREMIDKVIGDDLIKQLISADSPIREERLKLGEGKEEEEKGVNDDMVKSEKEKEERVEEKQKSPIQVTEESIEKPIEDKVISYGEKTVKVIEDNVEENSVEQSQNVDKVKDDSNAATLLNPDQSISESFELSALETLSEASPEPIPPAGGKELPKQAEVKLPEAGAGNEERSQDSSTVDGKDAAKPEDANGKDVDDGGNGTDKASDSEGSDGSEKADGNEESDGSEAAAKFTIKRLGNALKDRFKAFASKFAAKDREEEKSNDESDSESGSIDGADSENSEKEEVKKEEEIVSESLENEDDTTRSVHEESENGKTDPDEARKVSIADLIRENERNAGGQESRLVETEEGKKDLETGSGKENTTEKMEETLEEGVKARTTSEERVNEKVEEHENIETPGSSKLSLEKEKNAESGFSNESADNAMLGEDKPASEIDTEPTSPDSLSSLLNADTEEKSIETDKEPTNPEDGDQNELQTERPDQEHTDGEHAKMNVDDKGSSKTDNSVSEETSDQDVTKEDDNAGQGTVSDEARQEAQKVIKEEMKSSDDKLETEVGNGRKEEPPSNIEKENHFHENSSGKVQPSKEEERGMDADSHDSYSDVNVLPNSMHHITEKRSVATEPEEQFEREEFELRGEDSGMSEDTRDALLEICHNEPNLPACDQLRGTKIYRGKEGTARPEEVAEEEPDIGRLGRTWKNLIKIMKRIKLMKLGLVKLFHGPLSVMGLEEISHWIHDQVEHASPEVVTITVCCILLIMVLLLKSIFISKPVTVGASAFDVHKMRQSKQRILQENTEHMENEIRELREMLASKDLKVSSGDESVRDLQERLESLQSRHDQQEHPHHAPRSKNGTHVRTKSSKSSSISGPSHSTSSSSSSSSLPSVKRRSNIFLESIRKEVEEGKSQQKQLQELIEEKEVEIHEADSIASRHENEIVRQKELSEALNRRLEKVVEELDLKDGIVMELQEKNGTLHVELENLEMERRQIEKERKEIAERCKELEDLLVVKDEENGKLQDEIDEKENEVEVLRDCMAQINNGNLDGEAVEDFDTPEEDPDIKEQLKTERLKQIVESTQALANLKKSEKEKEYFQEGYLEELEKREKAEGQINNLKTEMERLSKEVHTYKNSSTEYQIKMETLQQYFKQQETELHRKLSVEEQSRLEFQRKFEALIGQSSSAVEETASVKVQNEDLKNEIKEMERSLKEMKIAAEKDNHELWIKNRQANRDLEEMKRERDIYRKRLLEAETARKRTSPVPAMASEKSRDSPAGSDDGRPQSPGSQKSGASGLPNFMSGPRPMFGMVPPPPALFSRGPMHMPMGPMPPRPGPFGPLPPAPPMMGGQPNAMVQPPNSFSGPPMSTSGPQNMPGGPLTSTGHGNPFGPPTSIGMQSNTGMPPNSMNPLNTAIPYTSQGQLVQGQQSIESSTQNQGQRAPLARTDSQKSLTSNSNRQGPPQRQTVPNMQMQRPFIQQPSMQGPLHSTPINSPSQQQGSQLPPSHPSLAGNQPNQFPRPPLQRRTTGNNQS